MHTEKITLAGKEYYVETSPLYFIDGVGGAPVEISRDYVTGSLGELIKEILRNTHWYYSKNAENKDVETDSGRWRSSQDIWRHVKYYRPEISLAEVMEKIFEVQNTEACFVGHYCGTIYRRVFAMAECRSSGCRFYADEGRDEYGFLFSEWENITSK